jgi:hypothetical protein
MIHRPGIPRKREKGQPEGSAIKSKTRKPRVANTDRKTCYAAGRNNSNPRKLADLSFEELIQISDRFELPTYEYCKNLTKEELINTPVAYLADLSLEELMTITDKIDLSNDNKSL